LLEEAVKQACHFLGTWVSQEIQKWSGKRQKVWELSVKSCTFVIRIAVTVRVLGSVFVGFLYFETCLEKSRNSFWLGSSNPVKIKLPF